MSKAISNGILAAAIILFSASSMADVKFEAGVSSGYQSNLIKDNNDIDDISSTASGRIYLYPLSFMEINGAVEYTYYGETYAISNSMTGGEVTLIPSWEDSPLRPYIKGSFYGSRYRRDFSGFDNNSGTVSAAFMYRAASQLHLRIGGKYTQTSYIDNDIFDQKTIEFFMGANKTFWNNNTLDIEAGFGKADYSSIRGDLDPFADILDGVPDTFLVEKNLKSWYISPRFSRPLGGKTGMNITYTYRSFTNDSAGIIFGSSSENLSPWSSLWEGQSVTATIKTMFFTDAIVTAGAGYFEKRYLRTLEESQYFIYMQLGPPRHDYQSRLFFKIQRPIVTKSGWFIEPSLSVEIVTNESTTEIVRMDLDNMPIDHRYDYDDFSIFWGIILRR
jgi:hypothetical protein